MSLVDFIRTPARSIPVVACWLFLVDFPIAYLTSGNILLRRSWSRCMKLIPLGIGLAAAGGFAWMYIQMMLLLVRDAGG